MIVRDEDADHRMLFRRKDFGMRAGSQCISQAT
jgi:hypothetical protein